MFRIRGSVHVICVTLGCGSLIRFLVTLFVVVVLVAGAGWFLFFFYGLLLFSYVLSTWFSSYLCGGCWLFSCSSERASVPV